MISEYETIRLRFILTSQHIAMWILIPVGECIHKELIVIISS